MNTDNPAPPLRGRVQKQLYSIIAEYNDSGGITTSGMREVAYLVYGMPAPTVRKTLLNLVFWGHIISRDERWFLATPASGTNGTNAAAPVP